MLAETHIHKIQCALLLFVLATSFPVTSGTSFIYPNGTTLLLSESDLVLQCQANTSQVRVDDLVLRGNTIGTRDGHSLKLESPTDRPIVLNTRELQFAGPSSNISVDGSMRFDTRGGGDIVLAAGSERRVKVEAASLDLVGAHLNLTGTEVTCQALRVDEVEVDGNAVRSTNADLELKCPAGRAVKVEETLAVDAINSTEINSNIVLSPQGTGAVKVAEGKTLDLRGATLLLNNDAISGDKVEGGYVSNITVGELHSGVLKTGLLNSAQVNVDNLRLDGNTVSSSTGDIYLSPHGSRVGIPSGKTLDLSGGVTLKLDDDAISGDKVEGGTIDSIQVNTLTSSQVSVEHLKMEGRSISTKETPHGNIYITPSGDGGVYITLPGSGAVSISGYLLVDNLRLDGNTLSGGMNEDVILDPLGTGVAKVHGPIQVWAGGSGVSLGTDTSGNVFIHEYQSYGFALYVAGDFKASGSVNAGTGGCTCSSDSRLKKDVTPLSGAVEIVRKLRGIRYKWKSTDKPSIGFVAQELERVVPEIVVTGSDGYKAVDYGKLSAVLAVAVQEMDDEIKTMELQLKNTIRKISKMERQHNNVIQRLESLEQARANH